MSANGQHFGFFVEDLREKREAAQSTGNGESGRPNLAWIEVPSSAGSGIPW